VAISSFEHTPRPLTRYALKTVIKKNRHASKPSGLVKASSESLK